ncbi:hypothetical protein [Paenibacillus chungangensis]|uniref:HTH cro/C1-type domain-containing protein n=1 Tax=Paenibacillus chungangensis TaxID=696535 RepID=A0ABW3HKG0_9BACL
MKFKARKLTNEEIELAMQLLYAGGDHQIMLGEGMREIGEILRIKRTADEMTLEQLGIELGMSPGILSEIENSKRDIPRSKEKVVNRYLYDTVYYYGDKYEIRGSCEDDEC